MSTITSLSGSNLTICLQSSEPIEPPPPVTSTTLLCINSFMFLLSNLIGSLPSKSSISTSLKFCIIGLSLISSLVPGRILTLQPVSWQISNIFFLSSLEILEIVKNITSTLFSLQILGISNLVPKIFLPEIA